MRHLRFWVNCFLAALPSDSYGGGGWGTHFAQLLLLLLFFPACVRFSPESTCVSRLENLQNELTMLTVSSATPPP